MGLANGGFLFWRMMIIGWVFGATKNKNCFCEKNKCPPVACTGILKVSFPYISVLMC